MNPHVPRLAAAIIPILAAEAVITFLVRFIANRDSAAIVNGALVLPWTSAGFGAWAGLVVTVLFWLWALGAATIVVAGGLRARQVSPLKAARLALSALPALAVALGLFVLAALAVVGAGNAVGWFIGIIAFAVMAVVGCRLLMLVPDAALTGSFDVASAWGNIRGRAVTGVLKIAIGVIAAPVLLGYIAKSVTEWVWWSPFAGQVLWAVNGAVIVAMQAATLAHTYLAGELPATEAIDERLDAANGRRPNLLWAVGGLALPVAVMALAAGLNPYGNVPIRLTNVESRAQIVTLGWPVDQHPVVVTRYGFYDCHDDACRSHDYHQNIVVDDAVAFVGRDGSVLTASSFRQGIDFVELLRCQRSGGCESGRINLPPITEYPPLPRIGLETAPDGKLLIAVLQQPNRLVSKVNLLLYHCAPADCVKQKPTVIWTSKGQLTDEFPARRFEADVLVSASDGIRVTVPRRGVTVTCTTPACDDPHTAPLGRWPVLIGGNGDESDPFTWSVEGLEAGIRAGVPSDEMRIHIGSPEPRRDQVVLRQGGRQIPLNVTESPVLAAYLVANGHRVLVVQETAGTGLVFAGLDLPTAT